MDPKQLERMREGKGFIAALDQSGGSTPKALRLYGIGEDGYKTDAEMFDLVHQMRTRIITSPAFTGDHILAAILFKMTMERTVKGVPTAQYLWEKKNILPILKVDNGLAELQNGVQCMKPIPELTSLLGRARECGIFGTKMRSVIKEANAAGVKAIVDQQFELGRAIAAEGFVPILEPEVDIKAPDKADCEVLLKKELLAHLAELDDATKIMFKLTLPEKDDFYAELLKDPSVVRIVALSGGYTRAEANARLSRNHGVIASFSRALTEGLSVHQTDAEFNAALKDSVESIFAASLT